MSGQTRPPEIQNFIDQTLAVMADRATSPEAQRALAGIRSLQAAVVPPSGRAPAWQPACRHLDEACHHAALEPGLAALIAAFRVAEPLLEWRAARARPEGEGFAGPENSANAMLLGPGGCEERDDIWLGLSLLAPNVRYPDHQHSPEEVYLVLSESDFFREGTGWFTPGTGGSFYNQPSIRHAMRSGETPLFAIWALRRV